MLGFGAKGKLLKELGTLGCFCEGRRVVDILVRAQVLGRAITLYAFDPAGVEEARSRAEIVKGKAGGIACKSLPHLEGP